MKIYELTYLISPQNEEKEAGKIHEKIKKVVEKHKGVLGKEQNPIKKTLAYPVKKNNEAYLTSFDFETEKETLEEIIKEVKEEENILRHILVEKQKNKKIDEAPRKRRKSLKPEKAKLKEIDKKIDEIL